MPKVLISDKLSPASVDLFGRRGIDADYRPGLAADDLLAAISDYDGLAIRSATKVTPALLEAAGGRLKVVGRAGIGVDNVDLPAASARGVVVMNTPFGNAITTAEHALSLIMSLARQIPAADASTRAGKWEKSRFMGMELHGKVLGVVGAGNIGSIVADRALGLKMKVIAYDPYLQHQRARDMGIEKVDLDSLVRRADIITLHTPLTDATRNILDAAAMARMRPGVRIVNCARGGLIDEAALLDALTRGQVAGAALDVFAEEPARANPLFELPNVICTPHLGAATVEAQEKVALQIAEQMSDYLLDGAIVNALNMPSISAEEAPRLRPHLNLGEQLGTLLSQVVETSIREIELFYEGEVAGYNTAPIRAATLAGLLGGIFEGANMVSAGQVAQSRGIKVTEGTQERCEAYQSMMTLRVTTQRRSRTVGGTVIGGKARLVLVEDIPLEAEFSPHMLYVRNEDKPGLIGSLGMILAEAGLNIANFHLGRHPGADGALAMVSLDEAVPASVLAKIAALESVRTVKSLSFC